MGSNNCISKISGDVFTPWHCVNTTMLKMKQTSKISLILRLAGHSFCFSYVSLVMCLVSCLVCHVFCVTLQVLLSLRVDDDDDDEAKIRIIKAEPKC